MTHRPWTFADGLVCAMLVGSVILLAGARSAVAQHPTAIDIANSLLPKSGALGVGGATRSLKDPKAAQEQSFLDGLRGKATRSITIEERNQVADIAKDKPSIDLEINFDYDSATIGAKATDALTALGTALRDPRLKGALVLLAGHTDGKGGDAYNKDLSDRRAEAVKSFLLEKFSLPPETLVAVGYGKERLKNTADPFAADNRRVQVVNLSAQ